MSQPPTLAEALEEACLALGHEVLASRMTARQHAAEAAEMRTQLDRLAAERDDLLHRADHAADPTV